MSYKGPRLRPDSAFGEFIPDETVCKGGWCNLVDVRAVVMGAFMDRSSRHNNTGSPQEVGVGVKSTLVPIN